MPRIVLGISSSFCANFLKGQVSFLVQHGWEVVIISGPGKEIEVLAATEKARVRPVNFDKTMSPFSNLACLFRIMYIILREKPQLVNAGNPQSGLLIMLACWLLGFKNRIFTLHGLVSDSKSGLKKIIMRTTERITCRIARQVIVVSPSLMEHAVNAKILAPGKGHVIEHGSCNGVNTDLFHRNASVLAAAEKIKNTLKLKGDEYIIGYVGRLSRDKGINVLFEGFNRLKEKYKHVRLLVVGPIENKDPFLPAYQQQLLSDPRIFYVGQVADVAPLYALMKMLVLASFREGLGNVLLEAAAMEIPVIAPDIPGCRNALQAGYNGFLFSRGDVTEMNEAIERYINDEPLRQEHGANGRQFVLRYFSPVKIWNGLLQVYEEHITG